MAQGLPVFPAFSVNEPGIGPRWKKWTNRFENLMIGMNIKDKTRQRALFLHYVGEEVNDIFNTLQGTGDDYETAKTQLTEYFAPKKCTEYEIFKFRQAKQDSSENVDSFHTRLRALSRNCEFPDTDKEIKSQIVQGCTSTRLRRKALRDDLTLDNLIKGARALELSDLQASEIENNSKNDAVNVMKSKHKSASTKHNSYSTRKKATCKYCGYEYPHQSGKCPADGKTCTYCKKKGHFENVCRSKQRNLNSLQSSRPNLTIQINGQSVKALIDTGSSINVIDERTYSKLKNKVTLSKVDTKVYAYGANKVDLLGKFQATIETKHKITTAPVYVAKGKSCNLLSYLTSVDLQVIPEISVITQNKVDELCDKYGSVFKGIGKMKDTEVKLYVDKNVQPVTQPYRRIPFHLRKQVEDELQRLEKLDINEKVEA
ncbi:uncharacterized protein K02A2.6-like [Mercenaria mercenaria]|uniref:uncharacterized protein K02A2.6-like n=1 Tax=Mercenaria mercenaria TaxID=6596 RepID=UPI00234EAB04|nr:uncharacterized protein K02A2.6-like [Mercenaria mercenaria]